MSKESAVTIPRMKRVTMDVTVEGVSQLVMHRWSEKAKKQILDKQTGKKTKAKEAKDPQADYEASIYYREDGSYGFPAVAFKEAMVRAGKFVDGIDMIDIRTALYVRPQDDVDTSLVLIESDSGPKMREDMVRVGRGKADIRYRAEFPDWRALLRIEAPDPGPLSGTEIVNLLNLAGFVAGVGEYRPEKGGDWGRFEVKGEGK